AGDTTISVLANHIAAALNATAALAGVVTASNVGGVIICSSVSIAFTLTCAVSADASETYSTGPQFPAWQATVSGGFSLGDTLTTTVNGATLSYAIGAADTTPAAIAANLVKAINLSTIVDPVTGLPIKGLVNAAN